MRWGPTRRRSRRSKAHCRRRATTASACFWSDPSQRLRAELARYPGARRLPVDVVHASEVITMDDKVEAIRAKRDSSIRVGLRLVREGAPPAS
jgi:fatty acid/phospholipid biosynthesis enzyme